MSQDLSLFSTLVSGLDHPEGIAYGPDGNVYATGESGQVYRISLANQAADQFAETGGFGLGIAIDAASNLYICDMVVKGVVRIAPDGTRTIYSRGSKDDPIQVPNYPVFDAEGNLYVSDSRDWGQENGLIYRIRPGGEGEVWCREANGYTNGMALSPNGEALYVVESNPPRISRVPIQTDGSAGNREVVVELPKTVPDGVAFDTAGNLYISCYAPDRIYRYSVHGELEILFDDWARMTLNAPTNLAFVGEDLAALAVASLGGYAIVQADIGLVGHPLHYPTL